MLSHWKVDQCYAKFGVDGSNCSIIRYLGEIENFCPLLPGRSKAKSSSDDVREKAVLQFDLEPLMFILKDDTSRPNYKWIRNRISNNWSQWTSAAKSLAKKQNLSGRPRLKNLFHLGLLSKSSGFKIVESSDKGGPLGELVQWSDIIATMYILGHQIEITSELFQLTSMVKKFNTLKAQCQSMNLIGIDLIYTDIVGMRQFKKVLQNGFAKFSCNLRIIDSFGTEPAFNSIKHSRRLNSLSNWGKNDLHPKQFYTMFPHTPDNSFMGFVVRIPDEGITVKPANKLNQAVVYGKAFYMWKGMDKYLEQLSKVFSIHATVYEDHGVSKVTLPSYVVNHGIIDSKELQNLLMHSKVFVGLSFPYEGPAPLEAIAQGCVFLNPKFIESKSSKNTKFFVGKPTRRSLTSQHPYAEDFIGEPHVITVDINNSTAVANSIIQAMKSIKEDKIHPFLPYEYTEEGMIQRLNFQLLNQDFCSNPIKSWIPESSVTSFVSEINESCLEACKKKDLICEPTHFQRLNKKEQIENHLSINCAKVYVEPDIVNPSIEGDICYLQKDAIIFSCVESHPNRKRLCPCRDFIEGQTALCKNCL